MKSNELSNILLQIAHVNDSIAHNMKKKMNHNEKTQG